MNIWLINPYDELPGEGPEQRYGCLARCLVEREMGKWGSLENGNSQVVWVSSSFRHRTRTKYAGDKKCATSSQEMGNGEKKCTSAAPAVNICLIDAPAYKKNVSVGRMWSQWVWGRRVERELKRKVASGELKRPDVILASSPPLEGARAGLRLAKFFGAKGVVDFMDDWPATWEMALRAGRWMMGDGRWGIGRLLLWPWFRMAKRIYSNADAVSAQSFRFAERAKELGFQGEVHVCYLGAAPSARRSKIADTPTPNFQLPSPEGEAFQILYLGAMGQVYDIETVLQAARMAGEKGLPWQWSLVGTDPDGKWQTRAGELGLGDRVSFPGYLQESDLAVRFEASDVGLVPMDPRSGVAVPYKAGSYLAAGLPILNSLPGELSDLLRTSGAGMDYTVGSPASLFEALKSYTDDTQKLSDAKRAARVLYEEHFNREKTYPLFAEWIRGE